MKDGLQQNLAFMLPIIIMISVFSIIDIRDFIAKNRKNMDMALSLDFNNSRSKTFKLLYRLSNLSILSILVYTLYSGIYLRNTITLLALIPASIGISLGLLYRVFVKPWKKKSALKILTLLLFTLVSLSITTSLSMNWVDKLINDDTIPDTQGLKVLSIDNMVGEGKLKEESGLLFQNSSFLIPTSYEYLSFAEDEGFIRTEYSKVLTASLAENLVKRYLRDAENRIVGHISYIKDNLSAGKPYSLVLGEYGINEEDFIKLQNKASKEAVAEAIRISKNKSIIPADKDLWHADQAFYLNYQKTEILLRKGNEVFYLEEGELFDYSLDFSKDGTISLIRDILDIR